MITVCDIHFVSPILMVAPMAGIELIWLGSWLFYFNGSLRQYFSHHDAVSLTEREKENKQID